MYCLVFVSALVNRHTRTEPDTFLSHVSVHDSYRKMSMSIFVGFSVSAEDTGVIHLFSRLGGCRS